MECRSCIESLTAYLDGELSPGEQESVEKHLALCGPCRQEHESLAYTHRLLDRLPELPLDPSLWNRISSALTPAPAPFLAGFLDLRSQLFRRWVPLTAMAGAAFLLLLVFSLPTPEQDMEGQLWNFVREREQLGQNLDRLRANPFVNRKINLERNPFAAE